LTPISRFTTSTAPAVGQPWVQRLRLHSPALDAAPVVRRIFAEFAAGRGFYAIAGRLTRQQHPQSVRARPRAEKHRSVKVPGRRLVTQRRSPDLRAGSLAPERRHGEQIGRDPARLHQLELVTDSGCGTGSLKRWTATRWPPMMSCMSSTWRKVAYLAVGGLTEVGFAEGSKLLVISHQGRGVVDLASGELLARDRQEPGAWFDAVGRTALGIGPLDGARISVCGLAGGRVPDATADGWQARVSGDQVTVSAPGRQALRISEGEEIRAFGFSPGGTTFIIATSPGLAIYRREDQGN
jgi:hypothetical protein